MLAVVVYLGQQRTSKDPLRKPVWIVWKPSKSPASLTEGLTCHRKEETWICILNQICLRSGCNRSGKEADDSCLYPYSAFFLNYWLQKVQRRYKSLWIFYVFFLWPDLKTLYGQADFFTLNTTWLFSWNDLLETYCTYN